MQGSYVARLGFRHCASLAHPVQHTRRSPALASIRLPKEMKVSEEHFPAHVLTGLLCVKILLRRWLWRHQERTVGIYPKRWRSLRAKCELWGWCRGTSQPMFSHACSELRCCSVTGYDVIKIALLAWFRYPRCCRQLLMNANTGNSHVFGKLCLADRVSGLSNTKCKCQLKWTFVDWSSWVSVYFEGIRSSQGKWSLSKRNLICTPWGFEMSLNARGRILWLCEFAVEQPWFKFRCEFVLLIACNIYLWWHRSNEVSSWTWKKRYDTEWENK
jgi:hypothetical protein